VELRFLTGPADESASVVRGILDTVVVRFNQAAIGVEEPTIAVAADEFGGDDLGAAAYYLPAFIAAVVLINGVMTVPAVIAGFRSDGTFKRLVATPLRKREWIAANVIQQAILAVVMMGIMVLVAHLLFGVTAVPGPLAIGLVLLGAVAFSALGITLGNFIADPDAATSIGGIVVFPMMFLSGVFWELDVMPPWLQTVGEFMPLYHFHLGLQRLMIRDSTAGLLVPVAVLGAMAIVFGAIAVWTTSWTDLDG
jgi:ABC-2 type transport system permease protein